jgi:hypothetical protein
MSVADVDAGAEAVAVDAVEQTNHPRGGLTTRAGGDGMFIDPSGEFIKLFVDPRVKSARAIIKAAEVSPYSLSLSPVPIVDVRGYDPVSSVSVLHEKRGKG